MRTCAVAGIVTAVVLVASTGCNNILNIPEVERRSPASACAVDEKVCDGVCVSATDPSNGCANVICEPCALLPNAKPSCVDGACTTTCSDGFGDCNGDRKDGCEIDLRSDLRNCGECAFDCEDFKCADRVCVCTTNASCGFQGTCDDEACTCEGTVCPRGAECIEANTCAE